MAEHMGSKASKILILFCLVISTILIHGTQVAISTLFATRCAHGPLNLLVSILNLIEIYKFSHSHHLLKTKIKKNKKQDYLNNSHKNRTKYHYEPVRTEEWTCCGQQVCK